MIQPRKLRDGRSEWDYAERGEKRTRLLQPRKVACQSAHVAVHGSPLARIKGGQQSSRAKQWSGTDEVKPPGKRVLECKVLGSYLISSSATRPKNEYDEALSQAG